MPPQKVKQEVVITIEAPERTVLNEAIIGQCLSLLADAENVSKVEHLIASALGVADSYTVKSIDRDTVDFAMEILTFSVSCHSNYLLALNSASSALNSLTPLPPPPPCASTAMIMTPKKTFKFFTLMFELRDFIHKGDLESAKRHLKQFVTGEIILFNREHAIQVAQEDHIRQQQSVLAGMGIVPSLGVGGAAASTGIGGGGGIIDANAKTHASSDRQMASYRDGDNISVSGNTVSFHSSPVPPLRQLANAVTNSNSNESNARNSFSNPSASMTGKDQQQQQQQKMPSAASKGKKGQQQESNENQQPQLIIPANQLYYSTLDIGNIVDFAASGLFQNWRLYHGAFIHGVGAESEVIESQGTELQQQQQVTTSSSSSSLAPPVIKTKTIFAPIVPPAPAPALRFAKPLEQWEADEAAKKKAVLDELYRLQEKEKSDLEEEAREQAEREAAEERARQEEEAAKLFFERHGTDLAVQHVQKELQNDIQQKHAQILARIAKLEEMYRIQL